MSNDHYYPQTYLKLWYYNRIQPHFVYDKKTKNLSKRSAKSVCYSVDNSNNNLLMPERLIEDLINPMENKLSEVIRNIDGGSYISAEMRSVLTDFFIYTQFYSPAGLRLQIARNTARMAGVFASNQRLDNPDRIVMEYPDGTYSPINLQEVVHAIWQTRNNPSFEKTGERLQAGGTEMFSSWRASMEQEKWTIIRSEGANRYITSDHPRILVRLSETTSGYLTPISPRTAIIRHFEDSEFQSNVIYSKYPATPEFVKDVNIRLGKSAERYVIGSDSNMLMPLKGKIEKFRTGLCMRLVLGEIEYFEIATDKADFDCDGYLIFGDRA